MRGIRLAGIDGIELDLTSFLLSSIELDLSDRLLYEIELDRLDHLLRETVDSFRSTVRAVAGLRAQNFIGLIFELRHPHASLSCEAIVSGHLNIVGSTPGFGGGDGSRSVG
ncbi:unnamed protein product [Microthlaspi erraticum]|uniref:Uncharacterized protein n=1 Tax=Microthlaspi erraticum TaxID=1685480 RepID=A0A6D2IHU7_9BRAS|nr:unnamed protein product [Microthlaspi erraticum]